MFLRFLLPFLSFPKKFVFYARGVPLASPTMVEKKVTVIIRTLIVIDYGFICSGNCVYTYNICLPYDDLIFLWSAVITLLGLQFVILIYMTLVWL